MTVFKIINSFNETIWCNPAKHFKFFYSNQVFRLLSVPINLHELHFQQALEGQTNSTHVAQQINRHLTPLAFPAEPGPTVLVLLHYYGYDFTYPIQIAQEMALEDVGPAFVKKFREIYSLNYRQYRIPFEVFIKNEILQGTIALKIFYGAANMAEKLEPFLKLFGFHEYEYGVQVKQRKIFHFNSIVNKNKS